MVLHRTRQTSVRIAFRDRSSTRGSAAGGTGNVADLKCPTDWGAKFPAPSSFDYPYKD